MYILLISPATNGQILDDQTRLQNITNVLRYSQFDFRFILFSFHSIFQLISADNLNVLVQQYFRNRRMICDNDGCGTSNLSITPYFCRTVQQRLYVKLYLSLSIHGLENNCITFWDCLVMA